MKFSIGPLIMRKMPVNDYIKKNLAYLKKVVGKGIEEIPCVVIESHHYLCGKDYVFYYYGSQSQVNKLFKDLQQEKKQNASLAFGKGTCRISLNAKKVLELDYAFKGTMKPETVKKNSKKLFQKMGVTLIDIKKGMFEKVTAEKEKGDEVESVPQEEAKSENINKEQETSKQQNVDDKQLITTAKAFQSINKELKKEVIPLLKSKEEVTYTQAHIDMAEGAYKSVVSFIDECETRKNAGVAYEKPSIMKLKETVVGNKLRDKYLNVWKKIKFEHDKELKSLSEEDQAKLKRVEELLKEIKSLEATQNSPS